MENNTYKLLLAATGSVATLKIPILVKSLLESSNPKFQIRLILTENAKRFFSVTEIPLDMEIYDDSSEINAWKKRGDPVIHIDLGKWADMMVIAPLDANTLAKIANGICDNLLTCTCRAWDFTKPLLFCAAMNTRMWEHPLTLQQITVLKQWGYLEIPPIRKTLMCGDTGVGAMAEVDTIVEKIKDVVLKK